MIREYPLPTEFIGLSGKVQYIQRQGASEYSSSCPKCGGNIHPGGDWPDRFRMFTDGKIRAWCRKCDFKWFPDMAEPDWRPSAEEIAQRAKEAEAALQRSIEQAQAALEELRQARKWLEYHEQMSENGRMNWRTRGLDDMWQDWWKLGYTTDYGGSATITIPIWGHGWQVNNIKHRLLNPNGKGKYIQETRGVPAAPFICDPDRTSGHLLICEGEIKSMVTFSLIDSATIQVAGLPTSTPNEQMLALFSDYEPIYVCPDPDTFCQSGKAKSPAERMVDMLGRERVRVIELPEKIDDMINDGILDKDGLRRAFKRARRL